LGITTEANFVCWRSTQFSKKKLFLIIISVLKELSEIRQFFEEELSKFLGLEKGGDLVV